MAFTGNFANGDGEANKTASASDTFTFPGSVDYHAESGEIVVLCVAMNNKTTTDGETTDIASVTDSGGNTFRRWGEFTNGQGTAAAGATISVWISEVTTAVTLGSVTVNYDGFSPVATAAVYHRFRRTAPIAHTASAVTVAEDNVSQVASLTKSGLESREYLAVRAMAHEAELLGTIGDPTAGWLVLGGGSDGWTYTTGAGSASNMAVGAEYHIATATSFTSAPTQPTEGGDSASILLVMWELPSAINPFNPIPFYTPKGKSL
jgi:hypothetical protein